MDEIDKLYNAVSHQLLTSIGSIKVSLAGVDCKITGKDAVGHLIQEWLFDWCKANNFTIRKNTQTQSFPDYFITNSLGNIDFLEIKNFHLTASPAFDVADFYALIETLPNNIEKLLADYLVFGYELNNNGDLTIPRVWKLKIWEIVGKSKSNHITCQIRGKEMKDGIDVKGRIQKFRPYDFKKNSPSKKFNSPLELLEAVQLLLKMNRNTRESGHADWLDKVKKAYRNKYGDELS